MITRNYKLLYAAYFGCEQRHIHYWHELSVDQKHAAFEKYSGVGLHLHVYQVSQAGLIIDRRLVARNDNGQIPAT